MDWWLINGVAWIVFYMLTFVARLIGGYPLGPTMIIEGLGVLIGVALLKRSKIAFWITLVTVIVNFIAQLTDKPIIDLSFFVSVVLLALALMLWQEVRKGKRDKQV